MIEENPFKEHELVYISNQMGDWKKAVDFGNTSINIIDFLKNRKTLGFIYFGARDFYEFEQSFR